MAIPGISSTSNFPLQNNLFSNELLKDDDDSIVQTDTLDTATAAQRALQAFQSVPDDEASTTAISNIGRALATGDLDAVQNAYSDFQNDSLADPPRLPIGGLPGDSETRSLFDELSEALDAGDLDAAQDVFDRLEELTQPASDDTTVNNTNPFGDDIDALDQALTSGDLEAARDAFAQLQGNIESNPPPPPPGSAADSGNDVQSLFGQLADALDSGDLTGAQESFQALLDELQAQQQNNPYQQVDNLTAITVNAFSVNA